jgi:hypothetical protein
VGWVAVGWRFNVSGSFLLSEDLAIPGGAQDVHHLLWASLTGRDIDLNTNAFLQHISYCVQLVTRCSTMLANNTDNIPSSKVLLYGIKCFWPRTPNQPLSSSSVVCLIHSQSTPHRVMIM